MLLTACLCVLCPSPAARAQRQLFAQGQGLELAIKATYLYKFAPFVEWPKSALGPPGSPFVLCVAGDDPFGGLLDEAASGQSVDERPLAVRHLAVVTRSSGCDILYAAGSPAQPVAAALTAVRGTPVLTVTDSERGGEAKGIINFVVRDSHVRFEIDNAAAAQNGLAISSKLLNLAAR